MEDRAFELIEKLYNEFTGFRKETRDRFDSIDKRFEGLEAEVKDIKKTVVHIEQDHGKKLQALFDGYKQHSDQLDRIEAKVSKHEDIIVRKIK